MGRQRQAIFLPILLMWSPVFMWSGTQQAKPPATGTQANIEAPAPSSSESNETKKTEKDSNHKTHIRLGAITVDAGYSRFSSRLFGCPYGLYPFGYGYSPIFWDPIWGPYSTFYYPGYFTGFQAGYGKGEVQLKAEPAKAEVFLDGAYAGAAQDLKNIWLDPGAYDLSVAADNREFFHERIYVLSGKKLKVNATPAPQKPAEAKP